MMQAVLDENCLELTAARVTDLRLRPANDGAVERLQLALEQCLPVEPDPRRAGFYEASIEGHRYYFHVFARRPVRVFLLACWRQSRVV